MDSIFLYLLNRKPSNEEKKKYHGLSQKEINKIIIRSREYYNFLEQKKIRLYY